MDYQHSVRNFNKLKNFIRPWTECQIFFFFDSETEYGVEIYEAVTTPEQQEIIDLYRAGNMPYGYIDHEKNGHEVLYYNDVNINIKYDLFAADFVYVYSRLIADAKLARHQFLILANMLKK